MKGKFWNSKQLHSLPRLTQSQIDEIESKAEVLLLHPYNVCDTHYLSLSPTKRRKLEIEYKRLELSFQELVRPEWVLSLIQTANQNKEQTSVDIDRELL